METLTINDAQRWMWKLETMLELCTEYNENGVQRIDPKFYQLMTRGMYDAACMYIRSSSDGRFCQAVKDLAALNKRVFTPGDNEYLVCAIHPAMLDGIMRNFV